jgi:5-methylcytosine-specific restriction endonuclease McrA
MRRWVPPKAECKRFTVEGVRLSGGKWTKIRGQYLRLNPRCEVCGAPGEQVHHIIPRAQRPDLVHDINNLQTVCRRCHEGIHGKNLRIS